MRTVEQAEQWMQEHSYRDDGGPWTGWSGALMVRSFDMPKGFATVNDALAASGELHPNAEDAPRGAFHWWDSEYGQVAMDLEGGGTRLLASSELLEQPIAHGLGYTSVRRLSQAGTYLGWTLDFGGWRVPDGR